MPRPDRFPRIRGDVPSMLRMRNFPIRFSPHTRGCSGGGLKGGYRPMVFPAYAGMFPAGRRWSTACGGFPRIRGDVPD